MFLARLYIDEKSHNAVFFILCSFYSFCVAFFYLQEIETLRSSCGAAYLIKYFK